MERVYYSIPKVGTGRVGFQVAIRTRLYAGPDHLLIVQNTGYTEEYKRVAYGDIRYLMVMQTNGQIVQGMVSAAILLAILLFISWGLPWWAAAFLAAPFLLWFIGNIMLGPMCYCYLNTHVQTVRLPAPKRRNRVPILLAFLRAQNPSLKFADAEQPVA